TRPEIMTRALLSGGTQAQKQRWLPKLANAEVLAAIAVTEPDFGSDVASINTSATKTTGGWLLNGTKTWCTFADYARQLRRRPPREKVRRREIFRRSKATGFECCASRRSPDGSAGACSARKRRWQEGK